MTSAGQRGMIVSGCAHVVIQNFFKTLRNLHRKMKGKIYGQKERRCNCFWCIIMWSQQVQPRRFYGWCVVGPAVKMDFFHYWTLQGR
ncbi:hypothetical protein Hdeb2414_s0015g00451831 [Helianthus debilis subsp. tardiflorus]